MITTLHIKNIGIIEDLNINLGSGFNVFTGETGAGKTLIIDAINIISGERFSKEMIRKGEEFSFVELNLYLPENEYADEGNIIVSREININGHNQCKINGRLVTVTELKEFMNNIIDIHGQNDNQKILNPKYHIKYLDNFGGEEISEKLKEYQELYKQYVEIKQELKANLGDDKEKQRQLDLLQYEFDEIDKAELKIGEEESLKEKSILFENSEKIARSINEAMQCSQEAVSNVNNAIKAIDKISNLDSSYESKLNDLKSAYYELEEFSRDLEGMNDEIYFDENERNEIEQRLDLIYSLKRKYGNGIDEILEYKNKIEEEINRINNLDELNNKLKLNLHNAEKEMEMCASYLHNTRMKLAEKLNESIDIQLKDLEMGKANFVAQIESTEKFNKYGKDSVQFYITTNIGEEMKPLDKIASGGEMSRIMLSIKTVLASSDQVPVMIFDEIDTGISGKAAKAVGQKLKLIGENHQVICITHQASIAAKGNQNYFISKAVSENRTFTSIKKLIESELIDEIARISNGDITDVARQHALELIKSA